MTKENPQPTRHPVPWQEESFYDTTLLDEEMRRVYDICHSCRRCFNLCDSFPQLFDIIDESPTGELDSVSSEALQPVVDACTLCDMCYITKCPYVPPHEFNIDFPHLMLRARAVEFRDNKIPASEIQLTKTDRNGRLGCATSTLTNWAAKNKVLRSLGEPLTGIDKRAALPEFASKQFSKTLVKRSHQRNASALAAERKAVIYTTCSANYNNTAIADAAIAVLEQNGVTVEVVYPECCGMPQLEHGDIPSVVQMARRVADVLMPWIEKNYRIISLIPSCTLMLKQEWPLLDPDNQTIHAVAAATSDICEYIVDIARNEGLTGAIQPLDGDVTVHIACHARAQNMGQKASEMLKLIPDTTINIIERCSGHGGSWGILKKHFDTAIEVGRPVARQALKLQSAYLVSECPLARDHIVQGMEMQNADFQPKPHTYQHPIQLLAHAYAQS